MTTPEWDERSDEQRARERDELARVAGEQAPRRRTLALVEAVEPFDALEFVEKLRAKAQNMPDPASDPAALERARTALRRRRMELAGVRDRDCLDALAAAPSAAQVSKASPPPIVATHAGNVALWRAVVDFGRKTDLRSLVLAGTTGTGKSWAAAWLCAEQDGALWLPSTRVEPCDEWSRARRNAIKARLAVFPDVTVRTTTWQGGQVADVLEQRHDEGRRTVVVTNLDDEPLARLLGDAATDRIRSGRGLVARATGTSLRRA